MSKCVVTKYYKLHIWINQMTPPGWSAYIISINIWKCGFRIGFWIIIWIVHPLSLTPCIVTQRLRIRFDSFADTWNLWHLKIFSIKIVLYGYKNEGWKIVVANFITCKKYAFARSFAFFHSAGRLPTRQTVKYAPISQSVPPAAQV